MTDNHQAIGKNTSPQQFLVSIYWDYQNIPNAKLAEYLLLLATSLGYIVNRKVYDNWEMKNKATKEIFAKLGFECINVSQRFKNAVDFDLFADCYAEAASSVYPHIFIIVSGDSYCELLIDKLQAKGKKAIVFARQGSERKTLKKKADEFHFIDELSSLVAGNTKSKIDSVPCQITYNEAVKCLIEAIKTASSKGKRTVFASIDSIMRQLFPNYKGVTSICKHEGKAFSRFSNFVETVVEDGLVIIENQELFLVQSDKLIT